MCTQMPRKNKHASLPKTSVQLRTKDLCEELLRMCSSSIDPADGLTYFKNMQVITTELSILQKDICMIRNLPKSDFERQKFLLKLKSRLGTCFLKSIDFRQTDDSGFGVFSAEDIQAQECVLRISMEHILSAQSVIAYFPPTLRADPLLRGMENIALSLSLLHELSLGEKSMWCDYLYSLPTSYTTVMYLSAEHMELLSGFPIAGMALNAFRSICRQYAYFFLLLEKTKTLLGNMKFFCFSDYCWAVSVVMSRNNRVPDPDCPEKEILCLIPLWDMINHRAGRVTTDVKIETKTIEFSAMEACPLSSEIFMDYGCRTSAEFLLYCGFVPPFNPHHRTPLILSLSKFDKLLELRTGLLCRLGYTSEISPLVSSSDVTIPSPELACFARVFVMNEDDLRQYAEEVENDFISASKRLLSTEFEHTRVDTGALTFLETRIDLLIKKYTSNLAKTTGKVVTTGSGDGNANFLRSQCRLLCEQDIALLRAYRDALLATRKRQHHRSAVSTAD
uniref:protein-histidine N-methyltransferase n=2 Tax=Schistocephalus solidus TaxID=70667 RepID=A0A0X3NVV4_SCHSO